MAHSDQDEGSTRNDLLQRVADLVPTLQHVREHCLPNHIPKRCLRSPTNRTLIVGHIQRRLPRIDDLPKKHRVHVYRHRILGQRLLCLERTGQHSRVEPIWNRVDQRHNPEQPRTLQRLELPKPQHYCLIPLIRNLQRSRNHPRQQQASHKHYHRQRIRPT